MGISPTGVHIGGCRDKGLKYKYASAAIISIS